MFMWGGGVLTCVSLVVVVVATKVVLHPLLAIDEKLVVCQVRQKGGIAAMQCQRPSRSEASRHQHCVVTYGSCNTENHRRLRGKECDVVAQRTSESSGAWKTLQGVQVGGWNVQGTNVDQQGRSGAARVERLAQRPLAGCSCQRKKCGGSRAIPCPCLGCRVPPW